MIAINSHTTQICRITVNLFYKLCSIGSKKVFYCVHTSLMSACLQKANCPNIACICTCFSTSAFPCFTMITIIHSLNLGTGYKSGTEAQKMKSICFFNKNSLNEFGKNQQTFCSTISCHWKTSSVCMFSNNAHLQRNSKMNSHYYINTNDEVQICQV